MLLQRGIQNIGFESEKPQQAYQIPMHCTVRPLQKIFERFFMNSYVAVAGVVSLIFVGMSAGLPVANAATSIDAGCPVLLQQSVLRLQDEKPQSLCQYAGKVVVVVNTASFCGFTSQYEGLEALHTKYKDQGLVVLGFPSNDFSQETGSNKQIADFCENTFGVKFPMFTKTTVSGKDASPLFKQLSAKTGTAPKWNFYKYVISRNGQAVESFNSVADPKSKSFLREIEKQLAIR